jgi:ABC-type uncharacterized transport system substrate-binding protein
MCARGTGAAVFAVAGALLLAAAPARAEIAILTQPAVAQYAQVVEGYRGVAAAAVVDVEDASALEALLARDPAVVVAVGRKAFDVALARATRSAIVAAGVLAPDPQGRADVTAVPLEVRAADAVAALAALAPRARRVVAVHGPESGQAVADALAAARKQGLEVDLRPFTDEASFRWAFLGYLQNHDAIWLLPDARLAKPDLVHFMARACTERRVALMGFLEGMTRAGALLSVAADLPGIGREAARLAADVASRPPEKRHHIPFRFAAGRVVVNDRVRATTALGGTLPRDAEVIR